MPKNLTGGKGHKKGKNVMHKVKRMIVYPDNKETLFAYTINALGDSRFSIKCSDEVERIGLVRGGLRGIYINRGDLVLVSLRTELSTPKVGKKEVCDILLKYSLDEITEIRENDLLLYKDSTKLFINNIDLNRNNLNDDECYKDDIFDRPSTSSSKKISESIEYKPEESDSDVSFDLEKDFDTI